MGACVKKWMGKPGRSWHKAGFAAVLLVFPACMVYAAGAASSKVEVQATHLACDSLTEPMGIDDLHPRLSWRMESARSGAAQTAYRLMVASRPDLLRSEHPDVWDSGRVTSDVSVDIPYAGAPLLPGKRYFWSVRLWDEHGRPVAAAKPSWWEMGLLEEANWKAHWISSETRVDREDRAAAPRWIWTSGEDALKHARPAKHQFRFDFSLDQLPADATLLITGKDTVSAAVNGKEVLPAPPVPPYGALYTWGTFRKADVRSDLQVGKNLLSAEVNVVGPGKNGSAGLIALLRLTMPDGRVVRYASDTSWRSVEGAKGDWQTVGYDGSSWQPAVIAAQIGENPLGTPWPPGPANLFRRSFQLSKTVASARLYVTALGAYQMHINGAEVGKQVLAPGWTDYKQKLYYQTYDVTAMLHRGENVIGALLGDGWYGSGLVYFQQRFNFGPPPLRLLAQMSVAFTDGTQQTVLTDPSWQTSPSAIRTSDLYNGEDYDARDERPGWDRAAFRPGSEWREASAADAPPARLTGENFQPIAVEEQRAAKTVTNPAPGVYVFDMGQNMVGTERLRVSGPRGARVQLRFAETLKPDGEIYGENMRTAREADTYTLRGGGEEVFVPHFTYHGYRYVEVTGYPGKPSPDAVQSIVFHSDAPFTGQFQSGSPAVNRLWQNILWSQRGNFESIPTDCPQRDERLGWMGDAQVFWRTASYNMDLAAFSEKFDTDMRIAQSAKGNFSDITPRVGTVVGDGSPGWADAGVIIPYVAWRQYDDTRILEQAWESMDRYLGLLLEENPDSINHRVAYGDWLAIGSKTPQDLVATAYWAYDADLMSQMAAALHRPADASRYQALFAKIRSAFQRRFVKQDGSVGSDSQTSYILALHMRLLPEEQRAEVAKRLVADLQAHDWHLTTGFLGTPYVMGVLSSTGHSDAAYRLLLTDTYPSWGYMVRHGATSMWERWNGDQMLGDPGMNSFNHYSYGAVGEWLYRYVAGIDLGSGDQGFHHFSLHPQFSRELGKGGATYESSYGTIASAWSYGNGQVEWTATIPANTSATVTLPAAHREEVLLNGRAIRDGVGGVSAIESAGGEQTFQATSGTYRFTVRPQAAAY